MPNTPILSLPYPPATGVTPNVPRDVKALAEATEAAFIQTELATSECFAVATTGPRGLWNTNNPVPWSSNRSYRITVDQAAGTVKPTMTGCYAITLQVQGEQADSVSSPQVWVGADMVAAVEGLGYELDVSLGYVGRIVAGTSIVVRVPTTLPFGGSADLQLNAVWLAVARVR